jgi:hypothetical protein
MEDWHSVSRQSQGNPRKCNFGSNLRGFKLIYIFTLHLAMVGKQLLDVHPQYLVSTAPKKTQKSLTCSLWWLGLLSSVFTLLWVYCCPFSVSAWVFPTSLLNKLTSAHSSISLGHWEVGESWSKPRYNQEAKEVKMWGSGLVPSFGMPRLILVGEAGF